MARHFSLSWVCLVSSSACSFEAGPPNEEEILLTSHESWEEVPASDDPFWEDESDETTVRCTAQDWEPEGDAVEVDTSECNYLTLSQPSAVAVASGQTMKVQAWWQTLVSERSAVGHFAVYVGDQVVMDEEIAIPGDSDARDIELTSASALPKGTPVYFHIHNHGTNSWSLGSLSLLP